MLDKYISCKVRIFILIIYIASEVKIDKTLVWIRFPSLGMEYYDESVLMALAAAVGRPIRVDVRTAEVSRGRFARVYVEIDLDQPVVGRVWFRNHWFKVEYEGLHLLCKKCGCFGHVSRDCTQPARLMGTQGEQGETQTAGGKQAAAADPKQNEGSSQNPKVRG